MTEVINPSDITKENTDIKEPSFGKNIVYCGICTLPVEYCEFGGKLSKCKEWLKKNDLDLYNKLYSAASLEAAASSMADLSLETKEKIERDIAKRQAKESAKAERELAKRLSSIIYLKRIERSKRKSVVAIIGLDEVIASNSASSMDLKKLAKTFASKFATGASVTKGSEGKDEIIVQGDLSDEIESYIEQMLEEKGLSDVKIEKISEKPKKKAAK